MTITIELPDELAERLRADAEAQGRDMVTIVLDTVATAYAEGNQEDADTEPLLPFSEYPSEAAYVAAASTGARLHGLDPETCAAIAQGIADMEAGRTLSLEEARAQADAALAERWSKAGGA